MWKVDSLLNDGTHLFYETYLFALKMSSWSTVGPRLDIRWLQRWVKSWNSVQFSHLVVSNSLKPNELQHTRSPCPPPTPRAYPNSCPLSRWCHITISSSVIPFSSFLQSFPTSGSFQMSQLFASGVQNIGVSVSTSILPMNTQEWFPLGDTGWISL